MPRTWPMLTDANSLNAEGERSIDPSAQLRQVSATLTKIDLPPYVTRILRPHKGFL